ncbi:MAG: NAD(+)/NADH kinase [Chlamydiia bacterium]|nr:NAD(+)/NADH kinase [Chlamydiia bacterium]
MTTIALFPNLKKHQSKSVAIGIKEFLLKSGVHVVVEDQEAQEIEADKLSSVNPKEVDYLISLGGDGTILQILHKHPELEAPIMGINLGSLGFLADIPVPEIYPSLQELLQGECDVHERMMILGESITGETCFAVNDIVFHRGKNPGLVDLSIHVDGLYLNTFSADGIIIATPIGSTAYSLAAGGPILEPGTQALCLTPISAHTISNRPIVIKPLREIQVQYLSEAEPVEISNDGIADTILRTGEVYTIRFSDRKFRMVSRRSQDYFSTLRTKLGWSGKMRA